MLQAVEGIFEQRLRRMIGQQGEIAGDLEKALKDINGDPLADAALVQLLSLMSVGTRLGFDQKTHKRIQQRYRRLHYIYLAAHLIQISQPEAISERVVQHLEEALDVLEKIRGRFQWNQLLKVNATLVQLDENLQNQLKSTLGEEKFASLAGQTLFDFNAEDRQLVSEVLGRRLQNDAYRQLLLQVISNQWVEYLTEVEALRIQVGMERYGQRDPLVQYKSKATDMFKELLKNIRLGVVSKAFTFRPRSRRRRGQRIICPRPIHTTGTAKHRKTQKETQAALITSVSQSKQNSPLNPGDSGSFALKSPKNSENWRNLLTDSRKKCVIIGNLWVTTRLVHKLAKILNNLVISQIISCLEYLF